ncbi:thioredoxin family protein [Paenibacillus hodogayensis]|uniref:Thioredoxin family protein n=1 Tax=Paenibacillus hodogayensis TaxID=279208 RepID=A0ABV5W4F4_9BACL
MPERSEAELRKQTESGEPFAVYMYTPLCGTCKVAARMLEIVEAMRPAYAPVRVNVNELPKLAQQWQVESVPCLLHIEGGAVQRRLYAFASVETVLAFLEPLYEKTNRKDENR